MLKRIIDPMVSFVNGTNDCEAHPKYWIAISVHTNCEKSVAKELAFQGIETYIPTQTTIRQWSDRKKRVEQIIIPSLVFVHCCKPQFTVLVKMSKIRAIISKNADGDVINIPEFQIETLKLMCGQSELPVSITGHLCKGENVRIIGGPLFGLEGCVTEADTQHSMVSIKIDGIGCASIQIKKELLEKIG